MSDRSNASTWFSSKLPNLSSLAVLYERDFGVTFGCVAHHVESSIWSGCLDAQNHTLLSLSQVLALRPIP